MYSKSFPESKLLMLKHKFWIPQPTPNLWLFTFFNKFSSGSNFLTLTCRGTRKDIFTVFENIKYLSHKNKAFLCVFIMFGNFRRKQEKLPKFSIFNSRTAFQSLSEMFSSSYRQYESGTNQTMEVVKRPNKIISLIIRLFI